MFFEIQLSMTPNLNRERCRRENIRELCYTIIYCAYTIYLIIKTAALKRCTDKRYLNGGVEPSLKVDPPTIRGLWNEGVFGTQIADNVHGKPANETVPELIC